MSYIGRVEQKASDIRRFNVTGSTSATHTLTWTPPNEQSLIITINGVKQQEDAYSVSGTTLTLTSALVSSDKMEVVGIQDVGETVVPGTGVITNDHISSTAAIAQSKLSLDITNSDVNASAAIALSKLASDPSDASNLASGTVPTARLGSGTASSSVFLRGDQSWAAAGSSDVGFLAYSSSNQNVGTSGTETKLPFNTTAFDLGTNYDTTNYKYVCPSAGLYFFSYDFMFATSVSTATQSIIRFKRNGSSELYSHNQGVHPEGRTLSILLNCSANDYIEVFATYAYLQASGRIGTFSGFKVN